MKRFFCLAATCLSLLQAGAGSAETIIYGAAGGPIVRDVTPGNPALPIGNAVWLGTFPTGFSFAANQTFASLLSSFTFYDSVRIGQDESGGMVNPPTPPGTFFGQTPNTTLPGLPGDRLFIWVFNSSDPLSLTPTAWAIVTNPGLQWTRPLSGPIMMTALDTSDPGTFVPAGAAGFINGGGDVIIAMPVAVPEPATVSAGFLACGLAVWRALRRRRA